MIQDENKSLLKCNVNGNLSNVNTYQNNEVLVLYDEVSSNESRS